MGGEVGPAGSVVISVFALVVSMATADLLASIDVCRLVVINSETDEVWEVDDDCETNDGCEDDFVDEADDSADVSVVSN